MSQVKQKKLNNEHLKCFSHNNTAKVHKKTPIVVAKRKQLYMQLIFKVNSKCALLLP